MQFKANLLQQLEKNNEFKRGYLTAGSLGRNKIVVLPVTLLVVGLFGAYECNDLARTDSGFITYMYACLVLSVICLIAIIFIQRGAKSKVSTALGDVPVCIAKKIYGNDTTNMYYGIYTPGPRRHDIEFIEDVAFRIFNIHLDPDETLKKQINKLFEPNFADAHSPAVRLPGAITAGEEVYQRQFSLNLMGNEMKTMSDEENEGRFIVLAFNKTNAVLVKGKDVLAFA